MTKRLLIHPFLLATYFVLALYLRNVEETLFSEILPATGFVLALAVLLVLGARLVIPDARKAGVIASLGLCYFLFYGYVFGAINGLPVLRMEHPIALTIWTLGFAIGVYFIARSRSDFATATRMCNLVAVALVSMPVAGIAYYQVTSLMQDGGAVLAALPETSAARAAPRRPLRDIYYIVVDRYAEASVLEELYRFDNRPFLDFLTDNGFHVVPESYSNYVKTAHSLASTLNLQYLDDLGDAMGTGSGDWRPIYSMLGDFRVWRLLKREAYQYIHMGSWWEPTRRNRLADENYVVGWFSEFEAVLFFTTVFYPVGIYLGVPGFDLGEVRCRRVLSNFRTLTELRKRSEPTFAFVHFLVPHDRVFGADGRCVTIRDRWRTGRSPSYVDQIRFLNQKIKELVVELLADDEVKPIIIIQSDEGPLPIRYAVNEEEFDWRKATGTEVWQKLGILNAYYFPGMNPVAIRRGTTPVNTFRKLFNWYFGYDFQMLPDRAYVFADGEHIYDLIEVTDVVRGRDRDRLPAAPSNTP